MRRGPRRTARSVLHGPIAFAEPIDTWALTLLNTARRVAMVPAAVAQAGRLGAFTIQVLCLVHIVNQHMFEVRAVRTPGVRGYRRRLTLAVPRRLHVADPLAVR